MIFFIKRALLDIRDNRFMHLIAIITIALSVLIVSAFVLFFVNASEILNTWKQGVRVMAYLKPDVADSQVLVIKQTILGMPGVEDVVFISREEALELLKADMKRQASLFENLGENQLPDAFEIHMVASARSWGKVEILAREIESVSQIEDVEYGQKWLGRFSSIFNLFRITGFAMGALFFLAAVFIVANTIRLILYSRREEVEIMRLVGASDGFIKAPLYIEGIIQGAFGGVLGVLTLFAAYLAISANMGEGIAGTFFQLKFLSFGAWFGIIICSMFLGWLGCYLSLKQFLKA